MWRHVAKATRVGNPSYAFSFMARRTSVSPMELFSSPGGLMALLYGRGKDPPQTTPRGGRRRKRRSEEEEVTPPPRSLFSNDMILLAVVIFLISASWELIKSQKPVVMEKLKNTFMMTLEIRSSQEEFAMIMDWMARQPEGIRCRNITLKPISLFDEEKNERVFNSAVTKDESSETRALFVPGYGAHLFNFHGTRLWVRRELDPSKQRFAANQMDRENDIVTITFLSRQREVLETFLTEVRESWRVNVQNTVRIFHAVHSEWRLLTEKPKRPLTTLYLPDHITSLVEEAKTFLELKHLYIELGIPWRRGFLLEGPPGTGKSSFVHALAGELQLPVHILSLQNSWLDDSTLIRCVSQLPPRCILLIEDIENSIRRPVDSAGSSTEIGGGKQAGVSLSALLNALDGITTSQGRLLIMTSNNSSKLPFPEALLRPGRVDRRVEFTNLSEKECSSMRQAFIRTVGTFLKKSPSDKMERWRKTVLGVPVDQSVSPALFQQTLLNSIYDTKGV